MTLPRYGDALGHGMSDKRIEILRGIAASGSISQAARDAGVSYKAAWQAIDTLTNLAGVALVARAVGGSGGGGATLTAQGSELLALADALDAARAAVQAQWAAGQGAGAALARRALRTSMRNQLPAPREARAPTGRIVRAVMNLGDAGLRAGMPVIALCKATAVRIERAQGAARGNRIEGRVASVARGEGGDEVSLALDGGLQVVGFAPAGNGLRTRQRAQAVVDESAVVVALPA